MFLKKKSNALVALVLGLVVTFAVVGGFYLLSKTAGTAQAESHTITLTEEGFKPKEITISQGDAVTFVSELNEPFWPASNTHPDHTIYPEFDPKAPIAPGESWTFVFDKSGVWRYHDHIVANNVGNITVLDGGGSVVQYGLTLDINECAQHEDFIVKRQCWEGQLEKAMQEGGVAAAFAYFEDLYKTEPDVPKECHGWSHTLGKAGYEYYIEHGTIELTPGTSNCGYGFYHAYLAELMKYTGDFNKAREFCDNITITDPTYTDQVRTSCKHGLGHGASAMLVENPENYGDFFGTAKQALAICDQIYSEHHDLMECYDGVFNELYQDILNDRYGYSYREYTAKNDPYWHCQQLDDVYKESCYVNVVGILPAVYGDDVVGAMKYILANTHDLEKRGPKIIAKIAADRIQTTIVDDNHQDSLDACALAPDFLYPTCFRGILNGFIQHGEPHNLHPNGYAFCAEEGVKESERQGCFDIFTEHLEARYQPAEMKHACQYAVEKYGQRPVRCESYLAV